MSDACLSAINLKSGVTNMAGYLLSGVHWIALPENRKTLFAAGSPCCEGANETRLPGPIMPAMRVFCQVLVQVQSAARVTAFLPVPGERASIAAQELVDAGLGPGLRVHLFDDDSAIKAATAVCHRQAAWNHHRTGRHASVKNFAALAMVDPRAQPDEDPHREDRTFLDHYAFDDLGARADKTIVLDDGGIGLQWLEYSAY